MKNQTEVGTIRGKFKFGTGFSPSHEVLLVTIEEENA